MAAGLRRYYGRGHLHFIMFSCYRRLPLLKTMRARDVFVKELGKVREKIVSPPKEVGGRLLWGREREAEGVESILAVDPAFLVIDTDVQPEVSEAACDTLVPGLPLHDSYHLQKFRV